MYASPTAPVSGMAPRRIQWSRTREEQSRAVCGCATEAPDLSQKTRAETRARKVFQRKDKVVNCRGPPE